MENGFAEEVILMKALSDESRFKIVTMLMNGELCACKILEYLSITQPTFSHHMRILIDSGLVESRRDGRWTKYKMNRQKVEYIGRKFMDITNGAKDIYDIKSC